MFKEKFQESYGVMYPKVMKALGRIYIISFNLYALYWLYAHGGKATWEDWLQWFFACAGMNFFYMDKKKEYRFGPQKK